MLKPSTLKYSAGRILCSTVFRPSGKKLFARGHVISDEDAKLLETEGLNQVWVTAVEEEDALAHSLQHLLRARPTCVLIASTTAPAGPGDVVGRAMLKAGCMIERFLAPVEPGNLLLLGYKEEIPVVSAPGCFRSAKPNVVDLILPSMLARYRIAGWEIAGLGHGGLLG